MRQAYRTNLRKELLKQLKIMAVELGCNQNDILDALMYIGLTTGHIEREKLEKVINIQRNQLKK